MVLNIGANGYALLRNPHSNKGTAFSDEERRNLGLEGLLPPVPTSLDHQIARIHAQLATLDNDLQKYLFLSDLQVRNETLYYAVLISDPGIIGVSTVPKLFNRRVIETISEINERPIIFPYSNPTSRSECTAEEAYTWSKGRAIFASGSPFPPLTVGGKHFVPGQGNNVYIFPAMGMAVYATEARRVTDEMFIVAARAVAEQVGQDSLDVGLLYPPQSKILAASLHVAARIAEHIFDRGLARIARPEDISRLIGDKTYVPAYGRID